MRLAKAGERNIHARFRTDDPVALKSAKLSPGRGLVAVQRFEAAAHLIDVA